MWKSKLFLSLLLLTAVIHLEASTFKPVDVATQIDRAELVFIGTVLDVESVPTKDGSFVYSYVTFQVDEPLKGAASGPLLTLRVAGGQYGGSVYSVVDVPSFKEGGRHLLFVRDNDRQMLPLLGGPLGKLDLVKHPESGAEVLIDAGGYIVGGLRDKEWMRGAARIDGYGKLHLPERGAEVVSSSEGVTVVLEQPDPNDGKTVVPAAEVIAQLRTLVQARSFTPDFTRGAVVQSASPSNVPATDGVRPARAKVK